MKLIGGIWIAGKFPEKGNSLLAELKNNCPGEMGGRGENWPGSHHRVGFQIGILSLRCGVREIYLLNVHCDCADLEYPCEKDHPHVAGVLDIIVGFVEKSDLTFLLVIAHF